MNRRRLWRTLRSLLPVAALGVVLSVLHGAGVPLSIPGVVAVIVVLVVIRLAVVRAQRRRRTDRR